MEVLRFGPGHRRPDPPQGCTAVEAAIIYHSETVHVVELFFHPNGDMWEHDAPHPILAVIIEGEGFCKVGSEERLVQGGEALFWPPGVPHKMWTRQSSLRALMIEMHA